jgi:hypothetical protein
MQTIADKDEIPNSPNSGGEPRTGSYRLAYRRGSFALSADYDTLEQATEGARQHAQVPNTSFLTIECAGTVVVGAYTLALELSSRNAASSAPDR